MPEVWQIMEEQLHFLDHAYNVRIQLFVLMKNHFHLVMSTPDLNLSEAMGWFMRETSRSLTRAGNRINQTYGGRYFRCVIASDHYYLNAYKYIYRNAVTAGVVTRAELYPFSTLPGLLGLHPLRIPVKEDLTLFSDVEGTLSWLAQAPSAENLESVRRALKKREFKFPTVNRYTHPLENDIM